MPLPRTAGAHGARLSLNREPNRTKQEALQHIDYAIPPSPTQQTMAEITSLILAVAISSIAVGVSYLLNPVIEKEVAYLFFIVAITFTTWLTGFRSGICATIIIACANYYVLLIPAFSFRGVDKILPTLLLVATGLAISYLAESQRAERERLARRAQHFHTLVNKHPHPLMLVDTTGKIIFATDAAARLFAPTTALQGVALGSLFDQAGRGALAPLLNYKDGESTTATLQLHRPLTAQREVWLECTVGAVMQRGSSHAYLLAWRDITAIKIQQQQQTLLLQHEQRLRQHAEAAIRDRDAFISIASHELRTPLTSILFQLQATLRRILTQSLANFSGEKLVSSLTSAEEQSKRLGRLIKDLLNTSLVSTGRLELSMQSADLTEIVTALVARMREEMKHEKCTITLTALSPVMGQWDNVRIEQAVMNLIANACKYGQGKPVEVRVQQVGKRAQILVRDNGIGIEPNKQKMIFDRFVRAVPGQQYAGLGVGLFLAKQIVEAHGGSISVTSQPGQGAHFTIDLPIRSLPAAIISSQYISLQPQSKSVPAKVA